jgi:hypothetical protein
MGNQIVHLLAHATLRKQNMRGGHSIAPAIHHTVGSSLSLRSRRYSRMIRNEVCQ